MKRDHYLRTLATQLGGPRAARERLLAELSDHIEDSTTAEVKQGRQTHAAEQLALHRLGATDEITIPWHAYVGRRRREARRRLALLTIAAATASVLAVAQHASGLRQPTSPCAQTLVTHNTGARNRPCLNPANPRGPQP